MFIGMISIITIILDRIIITTTTTTTSSRRLTLLPLISFLHCKKYQYGVFLLQGLLWGLASSSSSSFSSWYRRSWTSGLLFLNVLLADMSADREPKFSRSGGLLPAGPDREQSGSVSPWEEADRDRDLAVVRCLGVGVRSLDGQCRDKSGDPDRFWVLADVETVENRDNWAKGTETFLPFRIHEQATDVNILYRANQELNNRTSTFNPAEKQTVYHNYVATMRVCTDRCEAANMLWSPWCF